jgi:molecular chaperone DnaK
MLHEAEAHADEAHKLHELAEAKNAAEQLLYASERTLKEHRDKISPEEVSNIEGRLEELRKAIEGSDESEIRAKTEALQEASHKLAEAVYAQAATQAQAAAGSSEGGQAGSDEEVVEEADYEVIDDDENEKKG